jgi:hypothetical protein
MDVSLVFTFARTIFALVVYYNRCVVAQLVRPHDLYVHLHCSGAYALSLLLYVFLFGIIFFKRWQKSFDLEQISKIITITDVFSVFYA